MSSAPSAPPSGPPMSAAPTSAAAVGSPPPSSAPPRRAAAEPAAVQARHRQDRRAQRAPGAWPRPAHRCRSRRWRQASPEARLLPPPTLPAPTPVVPTVIRVTPGVEARRTHRDVPTAHAVRPRADRMPAQPARQSSRQRCSPSRCNRRRARLRVIPKALAAAPPEQAAQPRGISSGGQCGEGNEPSQEVLQALRSVAGDGHRQRRRPGGERSSRDAQGEGPRSGENALGAKAQAADSASGGLVRIVGLVVVAAILVGGLAYGAFPSFRTTVNNQVSSIVNNFTGKISTSHRRRCMRRRSWQGELSGDRSRRQPRRRRDAFSNSVLGGPR